MKNVRLTIAYVAIFSMVFTSCSKEESGANVKPESATLSFGAIVNDLIRNRAATKQAVGEIPDCSDDVPAYVSVVLSKDGVDVVGSDADPFEIQLVDGQIFTQEVPELQLDPDTYSLEHFAVYNDDNEVIWIAPRAGSELGGWVNNPLPLSIDLQAGVKKYVEVSVLCFDNREVNRYGYLFFELVPTEAIPFCVFGNFCDETGRHIDAVSFSVRVWNFSGDEAAPKGTVLYENLANVIWVADDFENGIAEYGYSPVCMALPDMAGLDQYYFEIYVASSAPNSLIRRGVINDDDVRSLFDGENNLEYYHFREGNCNLGDSPDLFEE